MFVAQTVTIGEQKVFPESESLKFSTTPTPQVENPSDSDSSGWKSFRLQLLDSDSTALVDILQIGNPWAREWLGKKKHWPEQYTETKDYKQKHRKNNMSIWPASLSVKGALKLGSWVSPTFSGALVNTTVLTLLLKSFAGKKRFSRGVLADTARFLRFVSLVTLPFLAAGSITDVGIAPAKHCNLVFCSFVLQIDWPLTKNFFWRITHIYVV